MSIEQNNIRLSGEYLAAAALVYNIGLLHLRRNYGFMLDDGKSGVTERLKSMDIGELEQRGIMFTPRLRAPAGSIHGSVYMHHASDNGEAIAQGSKLVVVSKDVGDIGRATAEITGHVTDPKVTSVEVAWYNGGDTNRIGEGEAAQRIGTNITARVVAAIHGRILADALH